jgi:hypothetical protein
MAATDAKEAVDSLSQSSSSQKQPDHGSHNDKEAFLSSFTAAEGKAIIRKVDRRFLLIIGMMYLIKNVSTQLPSSQWSANFLAHSSQSTRVAKIYDKSLCRSFTSQHNLTGKNETDKTGRLHKCRIRQSIASWQAAKHSQGIAHDSRPIQLGAIHILCQ